MNYTDIEKQTLELMKRTDFRNLSKSDVINISSQLTNLRPEVLKEILVQYPEFVNLAKTIYHEYGEILEKTLVSDDESLKAFYRINEKAMEQSTQSVTQFYNFAENVRADLSKCLDNPNLSEGERQRLLDKELHIFEEVNRKDNEFRETARDYVTQANNKDSEKRTFNWGFIKAASGTIILFLALGASILGSNVEILPHKKE